MRRYVALIAGPFFCVGLITVSPTLAAQVPPDQMPTFTYRPGGAQAPTTTQPPWYQTQERRPKEVKDKENETPLSSCENSDALTGQKIFVVYYVDSQTGTRTTIRKVETPEQPRIGSPIPAKTVWEILTEPPGQPKKKITYDLEPGNETRSEKTGKDKPNTRKVAGGDMYGPEVKKSFSPNPIDGPAFVRTVIQKEKTAGARPSGKIELAAAPLTLSSGPPAGAAQPQGMSITMKSSALGEPPQLVFALSDFSPPMTADEYVLSEALDQLKDEARYPSSYYYYVGVDNPGVFYPGDDFYTRDGEHIQIVGDWSLAAVPGGYLMSCGGFAMGDEDDNGWRFPYRLTYEKVEFR